MPGRECLLFHPAWEVLPSESRLPHADVISERLDDYNLAARDWMDRYVRDRAPLPNLVPQGR